MVGGATFPSCVRVGSGWGCSHLWIREGGTIIGGYGKGFFPHHEQLWMKNKTGWVVFSLLMPLNKGVLQVWIKKRTKGNHTIASGQQGGGGILFLPPIKELICIGQA